MNEKFAPELLESKADLVECMLDQIKEMASFKFPCHLHFLSIPPLPLQGQIWITYQYPQPTTCTFYLTLLYLNKLQEGNLKKVKQGDVVASLHKLEVRKL